MRPDEPTRSDANRTNQREPSSPESKHDEAMRDDLKAYLDGQLGPARRLAVRLHIARCAACRKEILTMENIGKELRAGDTGGLEPALRARILAAVAEAPTNPKDVSAMSPILRTRRQNTRLLWGMAATVSLAAVLLYPVIQDKTRQDLSPRAAKESGAAVASAPAVEAKKSPGGVVWAPSSPSLKNRAADMEDAASSTKGTYAEGGTKWATPAAPSANEAIRQEKAPVLARRPAGRSAYMRDYSAESNAAPGASTLRSTPSRLPKAKSMKPLGQIGSPHMAKKATTNLGKNNSRSVETPKPTQITVMVDTLATGRATIAQIARAAGGSMESSAPNDMPNESSTALTVRIPAAKKQAFLQAAAQLNHVAERRPTYDAGAGTPNEDKAKTAIGEEIQGIKEAAPLTGSTNSKPGFRPQEVAYTAVRVLLKKRSVEGVRTKNSVPLPR